MGPFSIIAESSVSPIYPCTTILDNDTYIGARRQGKPQVDPWVRRQS